MSRQPWWRDAVVYQIYPRSFADSNGDGIGDLGGIISRLDYLASLGVDVLWLSPIYPSPQDDNGYDISDYVDVEPVFGNLAQFDELLAGIHQRGMKLVMDLVVNHTSDEHSWFVNSRAGGDKRDWYWWADPRPGMEGGAPGAEPTNWSSFFSPSAWEWDPESGQYYLHLFSRKQPDLNWENPAVRSAVYDMMNWWLDRGVDGFRMDVINLISKELPLTDGISGGAGLTIAGGIYADGSAHFTSGPRIHEFLQEMHRQVFAARPGQTLTVGETPGVTIDDAILFTDPVRAEVDMVFQFEHMGLDFTGNKFVSHPLNLLDLKASLGRWQVGMAETGWNSLYWDNHDQPRIVSRFGDDNEFRVQSAKMLATVLHLHRGTPYIYQGEELGMTNYPFETIADFADIETIHYYRQAVAQGLTPDQILPGIRHISRDNARTPMQWSDAERAGFSSGEPWLPVNPNYVGVNVEASLADPDSVFHHYRALIELRHTEPAVTDGVFKMLLPQDPSVYAFTRTTAATELLTLGNFTGDSVAVDLAGWAAEELVLANYPADGAAEITLRPWETRVYRRRFS